MSIIQSLFIEAINGQVLLHNNPFPQLKKDDHYCYISIIVSILKNETSHNHAAEKHPQIKISQLMNYLGKIYIGVYYPDDIG